MRVASSEALGIPRGTPLPSRRGGTGVAKAGPTGGLINGAIFTRHPMTAGDGRQKGKAEWPRRKRDRRLIQRGWRSGETAIARVATR